MNDERMPTDSVPPAIPPPVPNTPAERDAPPPAQTPPPANERREWTWPAVTVTCVLTLGALVFAWSLIRSGADPKTTIGIALAVVLGVVVIVVPTLGGGSGWHRLVEAVRILLGDGGSRR
ncbi:hypothetical protein ACFXHA_43175 [Nocardia sp. NPDC059240]|uniref:hypothetical protein n=1 Tax=Nocardia sp. NPDC059240 TaxID=3346786 RepID=UPI0036A559FB